jgi:serine protease inhibitor
MIKSNEKFNYTERESLNSNLLELPYSGNDLTFIFFFRIKKLGINQFENFLKEYAD